MQTEARPDLSHYTYRVTWSAEDHEFLATCAEFPSLSWLASSQIDALQGLQEVLREVVLKAIASHRVGDRPDRVEPRVRKRRPKNYPLMHKPRPKLRKPLPKAA